jgi:hypothetical protein
VRAIGSLYRLALLPVLCLLFTTPPSQAEDATWNLNPGSGDWNTATNWTPNRRQGYRNL